MSLPRTLLLDNTELRLDLRGAYGNYSEAELRAKLMCRLLRLMNYNARNNIVMTLVRYLLSTGRRLLDKRTSFDDGDVIDAYIMIKYSGILLSGSA